MYFNKSIQLFAGLALLLMISFAGQSCTESQAKKGPGASPGPVLAELLDRAPQLGSPEEQAQIRELFASTSAAIQADPKNHEALLKMTEIYINEARVTGEHPHYYPAALATVNAVLDQKPKNPDIIFRALSLKASVELSLHNFEEALKTGREAVKINPHNAGVYGILVDAHVELGNYEEAVRMSDKMVSLRPDLRSYSRISYLREIHGEVEGSIEAMEMAVTAGFPTFEQTAWCRTTLAELYKTYGDLPMAEMQYQLVLENRPDYPFAIAGLAEIEMEKGNLEKAEELLEKACSIIPEVGFFITKAELYARTGREEESRRIVSEVLAMMAEDADAGHNMDLELARVHLDLRGDTEKALGFALREYAQRPQNIEVNQVLAAIYLEKGELNKAKSHLEVARSTGAKNPELLALDASINS